VWLKWQTRITSGAAAGAIGWMKLLARHPVVERALAAGELSASWARLVCAWSQRLPEDRRGDADKILCVAAACGADLADLARLAEELFQRCGGDDDDDGVEDRYFRLGITFGGAGRADGDLTPGCAAALGAVLEALGKRAGPEDIRTAGQRRHDALEEACRRLIAAGMVPDRAGQPTQVQVHMTLSQLRGLSGDSASEAAWAAARAGQPGWLAGPEADAAACDATVVPVVTGHVDWAALACLTRTFLTTRLRHHIRAPATMAAGSAVGGAGAANPAAGTDMPVPGMPPVGMSELGASPEVPAAPGSGRCRCGGDGGGGCGETAGSCRRDPGQALTPASQARLRRALLAMAADVLSGPGGLAARLRAGLGGGLVSSASLPLDIGAATETIPAHLRRAAIIRHPHCGFPGCGQPASTCQIHHVIPRSRGGPTALRNILPLCTFHHLIAVHRWGWTLRLNPDGSTTATSPDGTRTLHSHSPPTRAA